MLDKVGLNRKAVLFGGGGAGRFVKRAFLKLRLFLFLFRLDCVNIFSS